MRDPSTVCSRWVSPAWATRDCVIERSWYLYGSYNIPSVSTVDGHIVHPLWLAVILHYRLVFSIRCDVSSRSAAEPSQQRLLQQQHQADSTGNLGQRLKTDNRNNLLSLGGERAWANGSSVCNTSQCHSSKMEYQMVKIHYLFVIWNNW